MEGRNLLFVNITPVFVSESAKSSKKPFTLLRLMIVAGHVIHSLCLS